MENIRKVAPGVIEGFREFTNSIDEYSPLELKYKELILIGIMTANKSMRGVSTHTKICLDAGGTKEEVLSAVLYATPIVGITSVTLAFTQALSVIENYKD